MVKMQHYLNRKKDIMNLAFKAGFFFFAMSGYQILVEGRGGGNRSFFVWVFVFYGKY